MSSLIMKQTIATASHVDEMKFLNICTLAALTLLQAAQIRCSDIYGNRPVSQSFVCRCEYNYNPVCGSDGITYPNKCVLDCYSKSDGYKQQLTICTDSTTCSGCDCLPIYLPVCSVDGETFSNECELTCENQRRLQSYNKKPLVYLAYRAACLGPPCGCSTISSPVCGSDGVMYRNLCELNCANKNAKNRGIGPIEFRNVGACLDACQCPNVRDPICGSDGVEYNNLCEMECQNRKQICSLSNQIVPAPTKVCLPCACPLVNNPVCGSDGKLELKTYPNACELRCEAKRTNNPYLSVIAYGVCDSCFCTDEWLPVCGTDRNTYNNDCELRCANIRRPKGDPPVSVFHYGRCLEEGCDCNSCSNEYLPVCGSDSITYWNACWLNCNSACNTRGPTIYISSKGSCYI